MQFLEREWQTEKKTDKNEKTDIITRLTQKCSQSALSNVFERDFEIS